MVQAVIEEGGDSYHLYNQPEIRHLDRIVEF